MAEALGSNADIATALRAWLNTKGSTIGATLADTNATARGALQDVGAYNTTNQDYTTLLRRFLDTRNAP